MALRPVAAAAGRQPASAPHHRSKSRGGLDVPVIRPPARARTSISPNAGPDAGGDRGQAASCASATTATSRPSAGGTARATSSVSRHILRPMNWHAILGVGLELVPYVWADLERDLQELRIHVAVARCRASTKPASGCARWRYRTPIIEKPARPDRTPRGGARDFLDHGEIAAMPGLKLAVEEDGRCWCRWCTASFPRPASRCCGGEDVLAALSNGARSTAAVWPLQQAGPWAEAKAIPASPPSHRSNYEEARSCSSIWCRPAPDFPACAKRGAALLETPLPSHQGGSSRHPRLSHGADRLHGSRERPGPIGPPRWNLLDVLIEMMRR